MANTDKVSGNHIQSPKPTLSRPVLTETPRESNEEGPTVIHE